MCGLPQRLRGARRGSGRRAAAAGPVRRSAAPGLRRFVWWEAEADVARRSKAGRVHRAPAGRLPVVPPLQAEMTLQAQWALRLARAVARRFRPERVSGKDDLVRRAVDLVWQEPALGAAAGPARR